jgi:hypothetical protein
VVEPEQVECHKHDTLVVRRVAAVEVPFKTIQPQKRVAGAVKLRELQLVGSGDEVDTGVLVIVTGASASPMWRVRCAQRAVSTRSMATFSA